MRSNFESVGAIFVPVDSFTVTLEGLSTASPSSTQEG